MFPLECFYFWAPDNVDRIQYEDLSVLPDEDVHAKAIALATKVKALEQQTKLRYLRSETEIDYFSMMTGPFNQASPEETKGSTLQHAFKATSLFSDPTRISTAERDL